mgnify:CR=1 FL=1|jgi:hypothetical protein
MPTLLMINPYVTQVRSVDNYCLYLTFKNGEERTFDVTPYLDRGIFTNLKDPKLFATVRVVAGSIEWDNELDLSYDTIYLESQSVTQIL